MTIRDRILSVPETLSDIAWAAENRYRESEELLTARKYAGAVYLAGLACEMWLKLAAVKCYDPGSTPISYITGYYPTIRSWMTRNFPAVACESYHSVAFWSGYIISYRAMMGTPLPARLSGELRHHVAMRIFEDWKIDLRYRSLAISERHAWRVYNDVRWVRQNWDRLWR